MAILRSRRLMALAVAGLLTFVQSPAVSQQPLTAPASPPASRQQLQFSSAVPCNIPRPLVQGSGFVVTATGTVLLRPSAPVQEGNAVDVSVLVPPSLKPLLRVRRTSPFREPGGINILGAGLHITVPASAANRLLASESPPNCEALDVSLADLAPGQGTVEIAVLADEGPVVLGTFDFAVAPTYTGAFAFGPMLTGLAAPHFGLTGTGTSARIVRTDDGARVVYVVTYTPFLWGRRSASKSALAVNPTIGLALSGFDQNAMVGLAIDWRTAIFVMAGYHFGRVQRLAPESGSVAGGGFSGEASDLPTQTHWGSAPFVGIALELRAALALVGVLGSAPGGK